MEISLPPELEQFVADKVQSGDYPTAGEVVRDGLRLLKEREHIRHIRLEYLRKEIAIGIDQLDRGEFEEFTADDVIAEGSRLLDASKKAG